MGISERSGPKLSSFGARVACRRASSCTRTASFTRTFGLFFATAIAELVSCYLPLLWVSGKGSFWLLVPAAVSLVIFVWLLTLRPAASGRVYATYGAIYIATALGWLWAADKITLTWTDVAGVGLALCGAGVIAFGQRAA